MDYIDWSCPSEMEVYEQAKIIENNKQDLDNWHLGAYMCRAVSIYGKGTYPDKPMFQTEIQKEERDPEERAIIEKLNFELRGKMLEKMGLPEPPS